MMWLVAGLWGAGALAFTASRVAPSPVLGQAAIYLLGAGVLAWTVPPLVAILVLAGQKLTALTRSSANRHS
jgi:hypothetical protein